MRSASTFFIVLGIVVPLFTQTGAPKHPEPYSFMGFTVGELRAVSLAHASAEGFHSNWPGEVVHCVSQGHGITECGISLARDCSALTLTFVDDHLAEIGCSFMHSKYKGMVDALTEKFGAPNSSSPWIGQNAFGAKYETTNYTWSDGVSSIHAFGYSGSLERSYLVVQDNYLAQVHSDRTPSNRPDIR